MTLFDFIIKQMFLFLLSLSLSSHVNAVSNVQCDTYSDTLYKEAIHIKKTTEFCFNIINSIFVQLTSEESGGAIYVSGPKAIGIVQECHFELCQSKLSGASVFFSGYAIETFRCCVLNCTARFNGVFLSSTLTFSARDPLSRTTCDMISSNVGNSQMNCIMAHNGFSKVTNINVSNSRSKSINVAVEIIDCYEGEISFFNFYKNTGSGDFNSLINYHTEIDDTKPGQIVNNIFYGNMVENLDVAGGFFFSFIAKVGVTDCIFKNNRRAVCYAIRYAVVFDRCIFDGQELATNVVSYTNCKFLTETATWAMTLLDDCHDVTNDRLSGLKISGNDHENQFGNIKTIACIVCGCVVAVTIVVGVGMTVYKKYSDKTKKSNEDGNNGRESESLSKTPLMMD